MTNTADKPLVVLDTNCLIAIEQAERQAPALRQIAARFRSEDIRLGMSVVSSSENVHANRTDEWEQFSTRLKDAGLHGIDVLKIPFIIGLARLGQAVLPREDDPLDAIFKSLFPDTPRDLAEFARSRDESEEAALRVYRNRLCDASVIWSVWHAGGGWLVTADSNFHRKRTAMLEYHVDVMSAEGALERLQGADPLKRG